MIATLATRADEAGIKTCVVSTDRDAFQLVSENVCLMMTPRGVSDVNVYTPERVEARYGIRPDADPRLHRPQGRHLRQHPGRPGDRGQDRRAARRAVRLARGRARARRGAVAGAAEEPDRVRRAGARGEGARHDAARPRARRRPGRARPRAARPRRSCARRSASSSSGPCSGGSTSSTRRCRRASGSRPARRSPGARAK